jgi:hypothetical protein
MTIIWLLTSSLILDHKIKTKLIFQENFENPSHLSHYQQAQADQGHVAGEWSIKDGRLHGSKIHNAALWISPLSLSGNIRVEFDAWSHDKAGDIKCEIFGDGKTHQSGYIMIAGGWSNRMNIIARQDEHGEDRKQDHRCSQYKHTSCTQVDQKQHWVIERKDEEISWFIDKKLIMNYKDSDMLQGTKFAFNNWSAASSFDNLRVYQIIE